MNTRFLNPGERKKLLIFLKERFGIEGVNYLFVETGKEKIRAFSGTLSRDELVRLGMFARVEIVGSYFARNDAVGGIRLSMDALHILGHRVKEHIVELTREEFRRWMRGEQISTELEQGMYIIKYQDDFLGSGYSNGTRLFNYVPKERYLKFSD
jgi:NOL1/NOP2/fmu family ribosome biogenesis protein